MSTIIEKTFGKKKEFIDKVKEYVSTSPDMNPKYKDIILDDPDLIYKTAELAESIFLDVMIESDPLEVAVASAVDTTTDELEGIV